VDLPYYYLLPGLGFGLDHQGGRHAAPIPLSVADLKRTAAATSQLIAGEKPDSIDPDIHIHVLELYGLWLDFGGKTLEKHTLKTGTGYSQDISNSTLELSSLRQETSGLRDLSPRPSAEQLKTALHKCGYRLQESSELEFPSHIFRLGLFNSPIVCSSERGVMGEGKGLVKARSEYGALAETIERIVATTPDYSRVLSGKSSAELINIGHLVPKIEPSSRDTYSEQLCLDWYPGYCYPQERAWLPAEIAWHLYAPVSGFRAFDMRHTIGLAAGSSISEAFGNALLETIERDAYALVMRCRIDCPAVAKQDIEKCGPELTNLISKLISMEIDVHIKWISLDWPIPIAHVLLVDTKDRIPAHSHGCSAALFPEIAIKRALLEALQVHEGLARFSIGNWERMVARIERNHSHPRFAWGDPLYRPNLAHLINSGDEDVELLESARFVDDLPALCDWLMNNNHRIFWAQLGTLSGLTVVRVFVEGLVMPDNRMEYKEARLEKYIKKSALPGPYTDPILT